MMQNDIAAKLTAYAEGKIDDPETIVEIDALLTRYLDDQLDPETARQIAAVVETNAVLAKEIAEDREGKRWFEEVCFPAMREVEVKASPKLRNYVEDLIANPDARGTPPDEKPAEDDRATIVPFQAPRLVSQPSWGLMAASIGGLLAIAGSVFLYQLDDRSRFERTVAELNEVQTAQQSQIAGLQAELATVANVGHEAEQALADAAETVAGLEAERKALEEQLANLGSQARQGVEQASQEQLALTRRIVDLQAELATVNNTRWAAETALATATNDIARLEAERGDLERQLADLDSQAQQSLQQATEQQLAAQANLESLLDERGTLEQRLGAAEDAYSTAAKQLADAGGMIEELVSERAAVALDIARLEAETTTLTADLEQRDQQLDQAQTALAETDSLTAQLATERETLAATIDRRQQQLAATRAELEVARGQSAGLAAAINRLREQAYWLNQVAGYHRGYAGTMREVEVTDEKVLTMWLSGMLGRRITVPDLSDAGMTFVGGRLFFVNGWPVAQIAYHDINGQLFGFCLRRNPTGAETAPSRSRNGDDLYLIDWQDPAYQYVLIGFAEFAEFEGLAARLARSYRPEPL